MQFSCASLYEYRISQALTYVLRVGLVTTIKNMRTPLFNAQILGKKGDCK